MFNNIYKPKVRIRFKDKTILGIFEWNRIPRKMFENYYIVELFSGLYDENEIEIFVGDRVIGTNLDGAMIDDFVVFMNGGCCLFDSGEPLSNFLSNKSDPLVTRDLKIK